MEPVPGDLFAIFRNLNNLHRAGYSVSNPGAGQPLSRGHVRYRRCGEYRGWSGPDRRWMGRSVFRGIGSPIRYLAPMV